MTNAEVTDITQNTVMPDLESIEGVASASATGLIEESVNVIIRQDKIDAINEQVFGSIDEELKDAEQQLADGRQEIYDGQEKLNDSRADLDESRQQLNDSQEELDKNKKELEDSRQKIADGKAELAENKTKLEEGKNELSSKKSESTEKLAQAEKELLTAKADLEASKVHITSQITTVKSLEDGIKKAKDGQQAIDSALTGISVLQSAVLACITPDNQEESGLIGEDLANQINAVLSQVSGASATLTADSSPAAAKQVLSAAESALRAQRPSDELITNMEASLNANTGGLGADAYIASMQSVLSEIEGNIAKLDSGLTELYKGNLTAAIEFANAQTTISLGEMQITTAEAQIEASEKQLESGQKQIESGQEQIDSGWEQLKEGEEQLNESAKKLQDSLKQLAESEEDLEENRQNAYDQADMNGILTVSTVKSLLAAQNFSMPAGYVTEDGIDYLVRVGDKPEDVETLKKMPIMNTEMDGVDIIYLEDVADVFMTDNSADIYTNVNGNPGVMLTIQKQTGYSTGDVSDRIKEKFKDLQEENEKLTLITLMDQGIYIDLVMDSIINNVLVGALLAILILILFLKDIRPTMVVAVSIPISLITAIVCMYFSGVTLNVISLSGLALGVGMLVDNSIVVIENIYRLRGEGYSAKEAAIQGAGEVAGAILASTLTTVCVFLPIVFTEGITRQLFVDMGLTIAYSLLASLIVALTVVPAMASGVFSKVTPKEDGRFFGGLIKAYEKVLALALKTKPVVFLLVLVLLVLSAAAAFAKGTAFMPDDSDTAEGYTTFPYRRGDR